MTQLAIGIDIGGSGIKAGAVDVATGRLVGDRQRVATPNPSRPDAVVQATVRLVKRIVRGLPDEPVAGSAPIGIGIPSVVVDGVTRSAANIDPAWVDFPAGIEFGRALGRPVWVVNDADAAGLAEMRFGAGAGKMGVVLVLTLGTGVGSGLFIDGKLVPNTELGHMEIRGKDAEKRSASNARLKRGLSWKGWAADLDEHLIAIDRLFSPNLIILGGGVSKGPERFVPFLTVRVPVVAAELRNDAGIVGAAMFATDRAGADDGGPEAAVDEPGAVDGGPETPRAADAGSGTPPAAEDESRAEG